MVGQRRKLWASIGPALGPLLRVLTSVFAPKRNNKFRSIHSLYCQKEPFNNINYKLVSSFCSQKKLDSFSYQVISPLSQRGGDIFVLYLCPLSSSTQLVSVSLWEDGESLAPEIPVSDR